MSNERSPRSDCSTTAGTSMVLAPFAQPVGCGLYGSLSATKELHMASVTREITIPADPDEARADVSEPDRLAESLHEQVELDAWEGGDVRIGERSGTIHEIEPGRRLRFTVAEPEAAPTEIVFTVEPVPDGTRVRVTETGPVLAAPRL